MQKLNLLHPCDFFPSRTSGGSTPTPSSGPTVCRRSLSSREHVSGRVGFVSPFSPAAVHLRSSSLHSGRVVLLPVQADGGVHGRPAAVRGLAVAARGLCQSATVSRGRCQRTRKQSPNCGQCGRNSAATGRPFSGRLCFCFFYPSQSRSKRLPSEIFIF